MQDAVQERIKGILSSVYRSLLHGVMGRNDGGWFQQWTSHSKLGQHGVRTESNILRDSCKYNNFKIIASTRKQYSSKSTSHMGGLPLGLFKDWVARWSIFVILT